MAEEPVGSLGQETVKLLRALASEAGGTHAPSSEDPGTGHVCSTGWCPVCQVVGYVKANPDVVEEIGSAAAHLARTVRDAFDAALGPDGQAASDTPDTGEAS